MKLYSLDRDDSNQIELPRLDDTTSFEIQLKCYSINLQQISIILHVSDKFYHNCLNVSDLMWSSLFEFGVSLTTHFTLKPYDSQKSSNFL